MYRDDVLHDSTLCYFCEKQYIFPKKAGYVANVPLPWRQLEVKIASILYAAIDSVDVFGGNLFS